MERNTLIGMVVDRIEMNDLPGGCFEHVIHFTDGSICKMYYENKDLAPCWLEEIPHNLDQFVGKIASFSEVREQDEEISEIDVATYSFGMENGKFVKFRYRLHHNEDSYYNGAEVLFKMLTPEQQREEKKKTKGKWIWIPADSEEIQSYTLEDWRRAEAMGSAHLWPDHKNDSPATILDKTEPGD